MAVLGLLGALVLWPLWSVFPADIKIKINKRASMALKSAEKRVMLAGKPETYFTCFVEHKLATIELLSTKKEGLCQFEVFIRHGAIKISAAT